MNRIDDGDRFMNAIETFVYTSTVPDHIAILEYRIIMQCWPDHLMTHYSQEKLAKRWHTTRSITRKLIRMAKGDIPVRIYLHTNVVYFATDGNQVKIGTSELFYQRVQALNTKERPVRLIGTIPGSFEMEKRVHSRFADRRVEGEWFDITEAEALSCIEEAMRWL